MTSTAIPNFESITTVLREKHVCERYGPRAHKGHRISNVRFVYLSWLSDRGSCERVLEKGWARAARPRLLRPRRPQTAIEFSVQYLRYIFLMSNLDI
ncbi:hypothetical protein EVAR_88775_1 [Eumeta japonica]|uniref:Uncharacterized protein n=1 Tax=Eumeta variegata TaxID=151549 RepID=A0A4C1XRE0_EUMVA|nr:hypothetical protein EVAR_88775_1 [Eumeta japonica]